MCVFLLICSKVILILWKSYLLSWVTFGFPSSTYLYISQISLISRHDSCSLSSWLLGKCHCCYSNCVTCKNFVRNVYITPSAKSSHIYTCTCMYTIYMFWPGFSCERKSVWEIMRSRTCLWYFVICSEGEGRPEKRTEAPFPLPDPTPAFGSL